MMELRWVRSGDGHDDSPIEYTLQCRDWEEDGEWHDIPVVTPGGVNLATTVRVAG